MGQTADAILCELLAWNNCLVSAAGIFQPAVGGRPSGLNGMVANYVPGPLGTQYGYPHFCTLPRSGSLDINVYKGARCLMDTGF